MSMGIMFVPKRICSRPAASVPLLRKPTIPPVPFHRAMATAPPKTFSNQSKLPRLPVPDLDDSLEGYLKSLMPLLEQKYGPHDLAKELEKRRLFVRDFSSKDGLGTVLQERLKDLDHISPHNWLDDTLWLSLAYHTWRAPLLVNSNYWLLFAPDPSDHPPPTYASPTSTSTRPIAQPDGNPAQAVASGSQGGGSDWIRANPIPEKGLTWDEAVSREEITEYQIQKAAWMMSRYAEFRKRVAREEVPPDTSKTGLFCMHQYSRQFNFSRIPLPGSDAFSAVAPQATHATVMVDDFVYSIEVSSPGIDDVPEALPAEEIARNLRGVVRDSRIRREAGEESVRLGVLTADERDTWTKNRERLLLISPINRESLASISTSLLCLNLDTYTLPSIPTSDPLNSPSIDSHVRNGVAGNNGGRNRWLDKPTSLAVETNGRATLLGEHSPIDALVPTIVMDFVSQVQVDRSVFDEEVGNGWSRVDWVVDEGMRREIVACEERNKKIIEDSDASQLWWSEYGTEWIKRNAKVAPDAYIQQAIQLAWYRDQGYATATYETASTRTMLHGRTDVIRTLSVESRAFVKAMLNDRETDPNRYKKLVEASTAHTALTKRSSSGHGWDRHLMGLKVMLRGDETHQLFEDELYAKSQEWKLSTSSLAGTRHLGSGFGAAWPDGYGIAYATGPYLLKIGIESKWSCKTTNTARFKHQLAQAFRDMRRVVESGAGGNSEQST